MRPDDRSGELRPTRDWLAYFERKRRELLPIPWQTGPTLTPEQRRAIAGSIAEFQLGESSEGRHFLALADGYAARTGDRDYARALRLFIAEEQRHARDLGRFMDLEGIPRTTRTLGDSVFRHLRKLGGLELEVTVLVTAEILAQVYYRALGQATDSPILCRLCEQILNDEQAHVEFQCQRLAILRRQGPRWRRPLAKHGHRLLMAGTTLVVGWRHRSALRQGGFHLARFWRETRLHARRAFRIAEPSGRARELQAVAGSSAPSSTS